MADYGRKIADYVYETGRATWQKHILDTWRPPGLKGHRLLRWVDRAEAYVELGHELSFVVELRLRHEILARCDLAEWGVLGRTDVQGWSWYPKRGLPGCCSGMFYPISLRCGGPDICPTCEQYRRLVTERRSAGLPLTPTTEAVLDRTI